MGPETQLTDRQGQCLKDTGGDQGDDGTEQQHKPTERTPHFESVVHSWWWFGGCNWVRRHGREEIFFFFLKFLCGVDLPRVEMSCGAPPTWCGWCHCSGHVFLFSFARDAVNTCRLGWVSYLTPGRTRKWNEEQNRKPVLFLTPALSLKYLSIGCEKPGEG